MLNYDPLRCWPSAEELPDSDDTPVDNELQELIPGLLKAVLALIWQDRSDWFFGIDMGVYFHPDEPPLVPDGFLSLGVERFYDENLRPSYVIWDEGGRVPIWVLEVVSKTRNHEYQQKKQAYARLGVLYYTIYAPLRRKKERLEVYRLTAGEYQRQLGNPVWMPELELGIGSDRASYQGITREWLYWFDRQGQRFLTLEERLQIAEQEAIAERLRAERLAQQLKNLGIEPQD